MTQSDEAVHPRPDRAGLVGLAAGGRRVRRARLDHAGSRCANTLIPQWPTSSLRDSDRRGSRTSSPRRTRTRRQRRDRRSSDGRAFTSHDHRRAPASCRAGTSIMRRPRRSSSNLTHLVERLALLASGTEARPVASDVEGQRRPHRRPMESCSGPRWSPHRAPRWLRLRARTELPRRISRSRARSSIRWPSLPAHRRLEDGVRPLVGADPQPAAAGGEHPEDVAGLEVDGALVGEALGEALEAAGQEPVLPDRARRRRRRGPVGWLHPALGDQLSVQSSSTSRSRSMPSPPGNRPAPPLPSRSR